MRSAGYMPIMTRRRPSTIELALRRADRAVRLVLRDEQAAPTRPVINAELTSYLATSRP